MTSHRDACLLVIHPSAEGRGLTLRGGSDACCPQVPFDWTPGLDFDPSDDYSPYLPEGRREEVMEILKEAHQWLGKDTHDKVGVDPRLPFV